MLSRELRLYTHSLCISPIERHQSLANTKTREGKDEADKGAKHPEAH